MPTLAEARSPNLPPATFLSHFRTIRDAKRLADEANMALTRAKKAAKGDGVDLGALKIVEQLRKLDDDEAEIRIRHAFEYSTWLGQPLGTQAALFPETIAEPQAQAREDQAEWEAGDTGYLAGKGGKLRSDNPFPEGSPLFVAWDKQFVRGLKVLAAELRLKEDLTTERRADTAAKPRADVTNGMSARPSAAAKTEAPVPTSSARRGKVKSGAAAGTTTH